MDVTCWSKFKWTKGSKNWQGNARVIVNAIDLNNKMCYAHAFQYFQHVASCWFDWSEVAFLSFKGVVKKKKKEPCRVWERKWVQASEARDRIRKQKIKMIPILLYYVIIVLLTTTWPMSREERTSWGEWEWERIWKQAQVPREVVLSFMESILYLTLFILDSAIPIKGRLNGIYWLWKLVLAFGNPPLYLSCLPPHFQHLHVNT